MSTLDAVSRKVRVTAQDIHDLVVRVLTEHGAPQAQARIQAEMLMEADMRGQHSHGLQRLTVLVGRIRSGMLTPGLTPTSEWITPSVLSVDGQCGFGPVVAFDTLSKLMDRAEEAGIGLALIRNSHHIGMLAPYVEKASARGQIAMVMTTSEALVHPWGGSEALVGTNPIAVGIPSSDEDFSLDMATAEVSIGKVLSYAGRGEPIPHGWGIDTRGASTTDPAEVVAVSPFGGPKGYALGLAVELLVAGLTRTAFGKDVHGTLDTDLPSSKGDIIITISPERLGLLDLPERIEEYLTTIRGSRRQDEASPIRVPGDRAREQRRRSLADGIELDEVVWTAANALRTSTPESQNMFTLEEES